MHTKEWLDRYPDVVDEEGVFKKTLSQLNEALNHYKIQVTDFMTPDLYIPLKEIIGQTDVQCVMIGGFNYYERAKLLMLPPYSPPIDTQTYISAIEGSYQEKFSQLNHRDVLGALMSLGIQRKKIGDIWIGKGQFQFLIDKELEAYILTHLEKIARSGVRLQSIPLCSLNTIQIQFEVFEGTLASMRLDSVLSMILKESREASKKIIQAERVKVNYRLVDKFDYEVKVNDLISVKKVGRFMIVDHFGETKKGRLRLKVQKFI